MRGNMEVNENVAAAETTTETVSDAGASEVTPPAEIVGGTEAGTVEQQAYTPNYKFKYATSDKSESEEKEFDEWIRPLIKDKNTEKAARSLYSKAYGLDFVKPRYDEVKQNYTSLNNDYTSLVSELQELGKAVQRRDFGAILKATKIPEDLAIEYVINKLKYQEMTPDQRQQYDNQRSFEQRAYQGEDRTETLQRMYEEQAVQFKSMQLDSGLSHPDVAEIAKTLDAKLGQGAFKSEVIGFGKATYRDTGKDLSVDEAIQAVIKKYQPFMQMNTTSAQQVVGPQDKPVIPNVSGRNSSPAKKGINSLADLKARSKALAAELND